MMSHGPISLRERVSSTVVPLLPLGSAELPKLAKNLYRLATHPSLADRGDLVESLNILLSATPPLKSVLSKYTNVLDRYRNSLTTPVEEQWVLLATANLQQVQDELKQSLKYAAKAYATSQAEEDSAEVHLVHFRTQHYPDEKEENDNKNESLPPEDVAPPVVPSCKHRCSDKAACSHPCCKVGLLGAVVPSKPPKPPLCSPLPCW